MVYYLQTNPNSNRLPRNVLVQPPNKNNETEFRPPRDGHLSVQPLETNINLQSQFFSQFTGTTLAVTNGTVQSKERSMIITQLGVLDPSTISFANNVFTVPSITVPNDITILYW